jgi:hypothetical protein
MLCWICGNEAGTREHRVKATDLRRVFGAVSQKEPIYYSISDGRPTPVGSFRSDKFTSEAKICNDCNSCLTQPYDKAWEALSNYLGANIERLSRTRKVDLSRIFPGATKRSKIAVQLFFAKLFGCWIAEHKVPIDLSSFADAIRSYTIHDELYLSFIVCPNVAHIRKASVTEITAVLQSDVPVFAQCYYRVGGLIVDIIYCVEKRFMAMVKKPFHPNTATKIVTLGNFVTNHNIPRPWLQRA